jgi:hypothetical protein
MPSISFKKIAIVLLAIIALSRLDKICAVCAGICQFFLDSLQPWHDLPVHWRFVATLAILALLYITIFKLLYERGRK